MLLRVPMQSDNSFSMVRAAGSQQAACYSKIPFGSHCNLQFSNDQVESSAQLQNG
jgi:hypothetical protein